MNELNYASREASQRLVDAGIVLKTDFYWASVDMENWSLCTIPHKVGFKEYPAPSLVNLFLQQLAEHPLGLWDGFLNRRDFRSVLHPGPVMSGRQAHRDGDRRPLGIRGVVNLIIPHDHVRD